MNFSDFSDKIAKIKNLPLPGQEAHFEMAPVERIRELEVLRKQKLNPRQAGVMANFYQGCDGNTHFLLILRKSYPGVHSNQIAFPGGKREAADLDLSATALRETEEEVGVAAHHITVIRPLSRVFIPPSNFEVSPFLGIIKNPVEFRKQESEVEKILEVGLEELLDPLNLVQRERITSYADRIKVPAFMLQNHVVWGATAMMLNEIKVLFRQIL